MKKHVGLKNLRKIDSTELAREVGRKGGIAKGVNSRRKKSMKELAEQLLSMQETPEIAEKIAKLYPNLKASDITNSLTIIAKQLQKAKQGDAKAFELLRDTSGQRPVEKSETTIKEIPKIQFEIIE